jgi:hypothetical protein
MEEQMIIMRSAEEGVPSAPAHCTAPHPDQVQQVFVGALFPKSNVALLLQPDQEGEANDFYLEVAEAHGVDRVDALLAPFLALEFATKDSMLAYCRAVPVDRGMLAAYSHGEMVYDSADAI